MHSDRLSRFAVLAILLAAVTGHAAAQTLVANPNPVNLGGASSAAVRINAPNITSGLVPFTVTAPVAQNGQPWIELWPAGGSQKCITCYAPADFTVRLAQAVPTGTSGVVLLMSGTTQLGSFTVNAGSGTSTGILSPRTLAFTTTPQVLAQTLTLSGVSSYYTSVQYTTPTAYQWVTAPFIVSPGANSITANPAGLTANTTYQATLSITPTLGGAAVDSIPITFTVGAASATTTTATPAAFSLTGTQEQQVTINLNPAPALNTVVFNMDFQDAAGNPTTFIEIPPGKGTTQYLNNGTTFSVRALNGGLGIAQNTLVYIHIRPVAGSGYNEVTIPVTINPTGTGLRNFVASPTTVNLGSTVTMASATVTPSTFQNANYSMVVSQNLQNLIAQNLLSITPNASTGTLAGTGTTFVFYAPNAALIPATSGTVTIQSLDGTYTAATIYVNINSTGATTGSLTINPTSVTINATAGGTAPAAVPVSVTSADQFSQIAFSILASSTGNWLTVNQQTTTFGFTPATLQVGVNPYYALTAGTYSGTITITPQSGISANIPVNIPVTLNVAPAFTATLNPTSLALVAPTGGSAATGSVQVTVSAGAGNPQYTTAVTTTDNGNWLTATSSSTTLPATITISANPSGLATGTTYSGNVAIVSGGQTVANVPVTFQVVTGGTLQVTPAALTFTYQTTSTSAPAAQTVNIATTGTSVGWSAVATSTGNWLSVTPAQGASTPGTLTVSVTPTGLTPGTYTGSISVSSSAATNSPQTISVTLTVVTPALPQVSSVVNAASLAPTVAVPGMIFTIAGTDLGPSTAVEGTVSGGAFATTLGGVRVLFDGIPAPLLYVSANQINGVMPFELYGRFTTHMQVEYRNQLSRDLELRVSDASPGIFTQGSRGSGAGSILNQNNSVNTPANPEARGNVIAIYLTGAGQTSPAGQTGRVSSQAGSLVSSPVRVTVGGRDARVLYSGPAPGLVGGAVQVNAVIPADAPTGDVPVSVQVGSVSSQTNVTVSVR